MRCEKVKEKLSAFIDNELEKEIRSEIEQHLAQCPVCNKELELLSQTWSTLEVWEKIKPSESFESKFWHRVREKELKQSLFQRLLTKLIPVPTTVIILTIGLLAGIYLGNIVFPKETKVSTNESLFSLGKENFLYLDNFEDFPPESVGGVYIVLTSQKNDFK